MKTVLIFLIHCYRWTLGPLLHFVGGPASGCRFEPSCSQYAIEALQKHGALSGSWLAVKRIARCQPWGGSGYDPVPTSPISKHHC